jgi:hypothetical protein
MGLWGGARGKRIIVNNIKLHVSAYEGGIIQYTESFWIIEEQRDKERLIVESCSY